MQVASEFEAHTKPENQQLILVAIGQQLKMGRLKSGWAMIAIVAAISFALIHCPPGTFVTAFIWPTD